MNFNKAMEKVYDSYLYTTVARELGRLADLDLRSGLRNLASHMEVDRRMWLRKVGLQPYAPMRASFGTGMLLLVGAVLGAAAGLALAPMPGADLRKGVRHRANRLVRKADYSETQAPAEA